MPNEPDSTGWTISFFCPGTIGVTKALGGGDMHSAKRPTIERLATEVKARLTDKPYMTQ